MVGQAERVPLRQAWARALHFLVAVRSRVFLHVSLKPKRISLAISEAEGCAFGLAVLKAAACEVGGTGVLHPCFQKAIGLWY